MDIRGKADDYLLGTFSIPVKTLSDSTRLELLERSIAQYSRHLARNSFNLESQRLGDFQKGVGGHAPRHQSNDCDGTARCMASRMCGQLGAMEGLITIGLGLYFQIDGIVTGSGQPSSSWPYLKRPKRWTLSPLLISNPCPTEG